MLEVVEQEEVVQRGGREHYPEIAVGRGDQRRDGIAQHFRQQHDRALWPGQQWPSPSIVHSVTFAPPSHAAWVSQRALPFWKVCCAVSVQP